MLDILNKQEIEEVIKSQLVGRIGCNDAQKIYVVPVSYAYDDPYLYVHALEGMKIDMMRKNPQVCFEIDDTKNLANWKSVIAWGEFEELTEEKDKEKALQKLHERALPIIHSETMRISPLWPFSMDRPDKANGIFFRIRLTEKTGRFEKSSENYFYAT